jgi:hypothetical protein
VDRDDDPDFRISRLEDDQDDADDPDATPPLAVRMVRSNLRARKILDMGKPERYQAEIHLHLTKCEKIFFIIENCSKPNLNDGRRMAGLEGNEPLGIPRT